MTANPPELPGRSRPPLTSSGRAAEGAVALDGLPALLARAAAHVAETINRWPPRLTPPAGTPSRALGMWSTVVYERHRHADAPAATLPIPSGLAESLREEVGALARKARSAGAPLESLLAAIRREGASAGLRTRGWVADDDRVAVLDLVARWCIEAYVAPP